ncbi:Mov34/MPN/PAD-1 family protein [Fibrobacter sp. UWEL]|uniref:Mov34/MPN/PAD-1 family protein n=1 Tax=Fibrobacter sp. UWEL TaxID=1896209 RepID=UPI000910FEF2|nr:M67 family metallopeptidase [Fibrobacter sp. UWEL]SHK82329.1 Proteasome lid subunit RPN8/RPN11, contains Jab1/MPN metalloenzyme (JAMM) motif [Fibrobacter sp. UWEL]
MEIDIKEEISEQINLVAESVYPSECCGFLIGTKDENVIKVLEIREALNETKGDLKASQFEIDPLTLYKVEQELDDNGLEIVGFYHSHPDCKAIPSDDDAENMVPGLAYIILSVIKGCVKDTRCYVKDPAETHAFETTF